MGSGQTGMMMLGNWENRAAGHPQTISYWLAISLALLVPVFDRQPVNALAMLLVFAVVPFGGTLIPGELGSAAFDPGRHERGHGDSPLRGSILEHPGVEPGQIDLDDPVHGAVPGRRRAHHRERHAEEAAQLLGDGQEIVRQKELERCHGIRPEPMMFPTASSIPPGKRRRDRGTLTGAARRRGSFRGPPAG